MVEVHGVLLHIVLYLMPMKNKRVFKLKTFARWAKKILTDEQLCAAAKEILAGQYEADLGAGVCKKRIAVSGQGKRGATRTLVANTSAHGVFSWRAAQKVTRVLTFQMHRLHRRN